MTGPADSPLERHAPLWQGTQGPSRWVIWHAADGEDIVFDRELNIPAEVEDAELAEVVSRMRRAGVPESDDYPGRPC
ncbi:hypothetical protein [Streptomyces sp. NPDC026092]|uniref:hypothetical protein n=1 Tax=Streptomyces sp. NPDC026092 TaxID=3154797 RepID=UPI003410635F